MGTQQIQMIEYRTETIKINQN